MASNSVKYIFKLIDQYSPVLKRINVNTRDFKKRVLAISNSLKNMKKSLRSTADAAGRLGKQLSIKVTAPLMAFIGLSIRSAAKLETLKTMFVGITGNMEKANIVVEQLNKFTAMTPFQLESVANAAKKLLAVGVVPEALTEELRILGDISAASGKDLGDMARIYARVRAKGKASMEELNMLMEAGIPIIQTLAKTLNTTEKNIFTLSSKGVLNFNIIRKAMIKMTEEGNFAFKATILQAKTLSGLWSTVKDNVFFASAEIGNVLLPKLKELSNKVIELAQSFVKWAKINPKLLKLGLIITGIAAAVGPLLIISKGILIAFGLLASTAGIVAGVIAALGIGIFFLIKKWDKLKKVMEESVFFQFIVESIKILVEWMKKMIKLYNNLANIILKNPLARAFKGIKKAFLGKMETVSNNVFAGTLDININAPKGIVKQIATKQKGKNFKLGTNMAES